MRSRSKLFLLALGVLLAVSAVATEKSSPKPAAAPKLVMASLEHEFGKVTPGTPLSYSFTFKNKGKASLEIASVKPSCGCTKGDFDSLVAPGKEGKITLTIAKTDKYGGRMVKTASVTTNDPDHETFTLTLRADFVSEQPATEAAPSRSATPEK